MSGSSNVPVSPAHVSQAHVSQASVSHSPAYQAAGDSSLRWAALDSRHERLVTASDPLLTELGRKDTAKELLAS